MIEVHHLNNSRSQRVLWLLEELELPYEIVRYQRDPQTQLAPESLKKVHPLGKSPILKDGETVVIESGAILEYLVRKYGKGRLAPPASSPDFVRYLQLLHYAEGSAMLPVMLRLYMARLGEAGAPLAPRIASEIETHMSWLDSELAGREWFVGDELTAADIHLSFVIQATRLLYGLDHFPNLAAFLERIQARPAYKRSLERGGPYAF
ncbi:MAG: glutathione S-transferase [Deltaproteobacteria bacterium]|nr:glutathione S-transferase [Deltaproteobacteria bacterium]